MDLLDITYKKVLILGAIAAASAFVVTILIVLVCVGCQRKSKSKHAHANGGSLKVDMGVLRQSKLTSMSKSDTRLHEMHRLPCSANGVPKNRPASMDLLLLHSRRSTSDLRQLPRLPTSPDAEDSDPAYSEVGRRCPDDGLYESVGVRGPPPQPTAPPCAPHAPVTQSPASDGNERGGGGGGGGMVSGGPNEGGQEALTAEYATIRKVRKLERGRRENGSEEGESVSSAESSNSTMHRKNVEPFHLPNFPKEAVFMGNGEQYIWKPPEESDVIAPMVPLTENGHSHASTVPSEISEMYSTVCKTLKRKQQQKSGSSQPANGQTSSGSEEGSGRPHAWPPGGAPKKEKEKEKEEEEEEEEEEKEAEEKEAEQKEARGGRRCPSEEHCYETVGEKKWPKAVDSDPAYATIDSHRKRDRPASNTLKPQKKGPGQPQGPGRALTCENFYESIGDVKLAGNPTSTTTIFTFNDGMEMYVTGL